MWPDSRGRGHAHQDDQALTAFVLDPVGNASFSPYNVARSGFGHGLTHSKTPHPFQDKIKFILILMSVHRLHLSRFQAVKANHQVFSLEQGGFVKFILSASGVLAVMCNINWHTYHLLKTSHPILNREIILTQDVINCMLEYE
jgi:hypothetical protein